MGTGFSSASAEIAALAALGLRIEREMLIFAAASLTHCATTIRAVLPASELAAEFAEISDACVVAAEKAEDGDQSEPRHLKLVT